MPIQFSLTPGLEVRTVNKVSNFFEYPTHADVVMLGRSQYLPLYATTEYENYSDFLTAVGGSTITPSIDYYLDQFAYNFFKYGGRKLTFLNTAYASSATTNTVNPLNDTAATLPILEWTFASDYMSRVMGVLASMPPAVVVMPVLTAMASTAGALTRATLVANWESQVILLEHTRHCLFIDAAAPSHLLTKYFTGSPSSGVAYNTVSANTDADEIIARITALHPVSSPFGTLVVCSGWCENNIGSTPSTRPYRVSVLPPTIVFSVVSQLRNLAEVAAPPAGSQYPFSFDNVYPQLNATALNKLNNRSINSVHLLGKKYYAWGARTRHTATVGFRFCTAAFVTNLLIYALAKNVGEQVFSTMSNANTTLINLESSITRIMSVFYDAGLLYGASTADAFSVVVTPENNPPEELEKGNVYAAIYYSPASTLEKLFLKVSAVSSSELAQVRGQESTTDESALTEALGTEETPTEETEKQ
jgi:hypothetical protein